jgi:hypothetical protein
MEIFVAKERKKYWIFLGLVLFVVYFFVAARPIPVETILLPRWLSSLESGFPISLGGNLSENSSDGALIPFRLGDRFGYADAEGRFVLNRPLEGSVSLSQDRWAQYDAEPSSIEVLGPQGEKLIDIEENRGYPLFLDERIFLIGHEQNTLSALDEEGKTLWTYDFASPLTCIDAAAGLVLTGSLDGVVEVLDSEGKRIFYFEPGGSRLSLILGCTMSRDGNRLGIISGIDDQRFLVLERYGDGAGSDYRVVYHEFLTDGFRRAVYISFIDNDSKIVHEQEKGIGIYEIGKRERIFLPLEGDIVAMDTSGHNGLFFIITAQQGKEKNLVAIKMPGRIIIEAPFKTEDVFLGRSSSMLYIGGGHTLAAFRIDTK